MLYDRFVGLGGYEANVVDASDAPGPVAAIRSINTARFEACA
jgi:hypothetical protein